MRTPVRMYPYLTGRILSRVGGLESVVSVATKHEERIDGSGFPRGLARAELTAQDRLLAAAVAYHQLLEPRPRTGAPSMLAVLPLSSAKRHAPDTSTPSR
jgi:HD-GYP domain-containing protein (c-di-GMP phosphodiesterase class II)